MPNFIRMAEVDKCKVGIGKLPVGNRLGCNPFIGAWLDSFCDVASDIYKTRTCEVAELFPVQKESRSQSVCFAVFKQTWNGPHQGVEVITGNTVAGCVDSAEHRCVARQRTAWHHRSGIPCNRTACSQRVDGGGIGLLKRIWSAAIDRKEQNPAALRVTLRALHLPIVPMVTCKVCADIMSLA